MKIESILDCVGDTPLLNVNNIINRYNLKAYVLSWHLSIQFYKKREL